ncbi:hypothetical protein GA0061103_1927 [Rhizobium multihospitium]|uniref:Uncharacterized protein n=1 Tax=Rhizobium multihospitium TaxID=410764 RepID=A0A1C3UCN2_9HYPH|nr:hypothetical protein GA0061103_1927 [Rhizobium multihospitium]
MIFVFNRLFLKNPSPMSQMIEEQLTRKTTTCRILPIAPKIGGKAAAATVMA